MAILSAKVEGAVSLAWGLPFLGSGPTSGKAWHRRWPTIPMRGNMRCPTDCLNRTKLPGPISKRTRAIVRVSPSSPTGTIFSRELLLQVGTIAKENGLLLLIDDPYSNFTYENRARYFNPASQNEFKANTVYFFTFSKSCAMSGWRLGYMILPSQLKKEALKVHDTTKICAPHISQIAGIAALKGAPEHLKRFEQTQGSRRQLIRQRLDRVPHLFEYIPPEGAYYLFPKILAPHQYAHEFSLRLLNEAKAWVTPGSAFGPSGEHHVRMTYCVDEEVINSAFDRIEHYFDTG